jgi:anti-sigma factor RsiW
MKPDPMTETELHAYLDGELPVTRRAEVESYLEDHPDEEARLASYREQRERFHSAYDPVLDETIPQRLLNVNTPARWRAYLPHAAVIAAFSLGGLAGWHLHGTSVSRDAEALRWARRAAIAHVVYSPEVRHPVEVGADQENHLVAWLSKRLGTQLKIPVLGSAGYGLVGGRLLPGERGPVAQFMYQESSGRRLTLYVRTSVEGSKETAFRFTSENGIGVFYWVDRNLGYALSGDTDREELMRVATVVYRQLNP